MAVFRIKTFDRRRDCVEERDVLRFEQANAYNTEFFFENLDYKDFQILSCVRESDKPLGAWAIKEQLEKLHIEISTTTVGRRLKSMEEQGHLVPKSNLGRIITPKGIEFLENAEHLLNKNRLTQNIVENISVTHYMHLADIYETRRGLETEAVRLAAMCATPEELEELRNNTWQYRTITETNPTDKEILQVSLEFHYLIAGICRNHFIATLLNIILNENSHFEQGLKNPFTHNCCRECADEHEKITDAIASGDAEKAANLMYQHMSFIIAKEKHQIEYINRCKAP